MGTLQAASEALWEDARVRRVLIVQEHSPHYRVSFFEALREKLQAQGVILDLVVGKVTRSQYLKGEVSWATPVEVVQFGPFRWHRGTLKMAVAADLVIAPQEVKYPVPLLLQLIARFSRRKFAFWGHGKNFQAAHTGSIPEKVKRFLSRRVDWWFAYNNLSFRVVRDLGYPEDRITCVGNAIDTDVMARQMENLNAQELAALRRELGIKSQNVAVYTGGLQANKRLGFLMEAAQLIRRDIPDFELIIIGDGPERGSVQAAAVGSSWLHMVGPKNDYEKVPYWALSKMLLMPGGVGLVILDSFALGVPMVTTDTRLHGPEIDYLRDGENGVLVPCGESVSQYAAAVVELFRSPERLAALTRSARESARLYSIEQMAANFARGVAQALAAPRMNG